MFGVVGVDKLGVDKLGVDKLGVDKLGVNKLGVVEVVVLGGGASVLLFLCLFRLSKVE
jgi:hypothetical protein